MTTEQPPVDAPPAETPPAETPPAETPPAEEAAQQPDVPATPATVATEPPPRQRRRDRVLGTIGQVVGIIGLVVCLVLAFGVILGRGWAVGTVDDVAAAAVAQVAKAEPLLSQASARVGEISGRVSTVADIAAGIAANPNPAPGVAEGLRSALAGVSDRYQGLRSNYTDVRESLVSLGDRLQTLKRLVPGFSIPEGPTDALAALDARLREFDSNLTGFIDIEPGEGPLSLAATAIAERASEVNARIEGLQGRLGDVEERVSALEARILDAAGSIKAAITIGSIAAVLLWLYLAFLHWVLYRHSGELRRKQSAG
jgi:hypothetical protein